MNKRMHGRGLGELITAPLRLLRRVWLKNDLSWIKLQIREEVARQKRHKQYLRTLLAEQYRLESIINPSNKLYSGWSHAPKEQAK